MYTRFWRCSRRYFSESVDSLISRTGSSHTLQAFFLCFTHLTRVRWVKHHCTIIFVFFQIFVNLFLEKELYEVNRRIKAAHVAVWGLDLQRITVCSSPPMAPRIILEQLSMAEFWPNESNAASPIKWKALNDEFLFGGGGTEPLQTMKVHTMLVPCVSRAAPSVKVPNFVGDNDQIWDFRGTMGSPVSFTKEIVSFPMEIINLMIWVSEGNLSMILEHNLLSHGRFVSRLEQVSQTQIHSVGSPCVLWSPDRNQDCARLVGSRKPSLT